MKKISSRYIAIFSRGGFRLISEKLLRCAFGMVVGFSLFAFSANAETKVYVVKDNPNAAEPYNTWETAAATVKTATIFATNLVGTAQAESVEVLVGKGEYNNDNNIYLCAGVTLRGATGNRDDVVIGQSTYTSKTTKRIVVAKGSGAIVADLTITGGYVYAHAGNGKYDYGGGAHLSSGATITNCHITACIGHYGGAGAGLALESAFAYDCLVDKCTTKPWKQETPICTKGYAVYVTGASVMDRCQIVDNKATGTKYSTNQYGGALCVFNNTSANYKDSCIIRNTLIARNSVTYTSNDNGYMGIGLSLKGGLVENCTIVSNMANVDGKSAGVVVYKDDNGTVRNCHIAENYCGSRLNNYGTHTGAVSHYRRYESSCTSPAHDSLGAGCVVDENGTWCFDRKGRVKLLEGSPCIGAASQQAWMEGATDLYGRERKLYGKADIGAVEFVKSLGFNVIVR